MTQERVLIIEDVEKMRELISSCLTEYEIGNKAVATGKDALRLLNKQNFDLILLDLNLDDYKGFNFLSLLTVKAPKTLIIIVSALKKPNNIITGLEIGADDYITKPFHEEELIARVRSNLRRVDLFKQKHNPAPKVITFGNLKLDITNHKVYKRNSEIFLSFTLFRLLQLLMESPGQIFSKEQIKNQIWDESCISDNCVMLTICKLRDIIEDDPKSPKYIETIRKMGYRLKEFEP